MTIPRILFADASFYTAISNRRDPHYSKADAWQKAIFQARVSIITTEAVLWEYLNSCAAPPVRRYAYRAYRYLHTDPQVQVIGFDPALCAAALQSYEAHHDKNWGIVDCLSFDVMQQHGVHDALTTDHHFVQAGFTALLLQDPPA